jgi:hypothetical protein
MTAMANHSHKVGLLSRRFTGRPLRWLAWGALCVALAGAGAFGLTVLEAHVLGMNAHAGPGRGAASVELACLPQWMPAALARALANDLTPPQANLSDPRLTEKVAELAAQHPWVRKVEQVAVRVLADGRGIVDLSAAYRRPVARVRHKGELVFVGDDGHVLPSEQVPQYVVSFADGKGGYARQISFVAPGDVRKQWQPSARRIHYVVIEGVKTDPPQPGWKWDAPDLLDGLRLVELVRTKPYLAQIATIDVRNHANRISRSEPELRVLAQVGRGKTTEIRFGRFPIGNGDFVVSPERKMSYLDAYVADHGGKLAGFHDYLDLRFDHLHLSPT